MTAANPPCPCRSGRRYDRCCRPLHEGRDAASPEELMRSRYAAYARGRSAYVIDTTDPAGPQGRSDRRAWETEVRAFCRGTRFEGLEVQDSGEDGDDGWVRFRARLSQGGRDASFVEKSRFVRRDGRWLYHSGEVEGG